jgi:cell cycle checkpoint control protein RAD9A
MALLRLTLSEEGVGAFHDVLACILKFSEDVTLEARKDKVGDVSLL